MSLIYYFLWPSSYVSFSSMFNSKIRRNYCSFIHSTVVTSMILNNYLNNNAYYKEIASFSSSYFIWDSFEILYNKRNEKLYLYHHIVMLYLLGNIYFNINVKELLFIFFIGEISNFFNYIVYHMIKIKTKKNILSIFKIIQFLWFSYFRLYILTPCITKFYNVLESDFLYYNLIIIYLIGLKWCIKQLLHLLN